MKNVYQYPPDMACEENLHDQGSAQHPDMAKWPTQAAYNILGDKETKPTFVKS